MIKKIFKVSKKQGGFTLIEVIIAMAIVVLVALPIGMAFQVALSNNIKANRQLQANQIGHSLMEYAKGIPLENLSELDGKEIDNGLVDLPDNYKARIFVKKLEDDIFKKPKFEGINIYGDYAIYISKEDEEILLKIPNPTMGASPIEKQIGKFDPNRGVNLDIAYNDIGTATISSLGIPSRKESLSVKKIQDGGQAALGGTSPSFYLMTLVTVGFQENDQVNLNIKNNSGEEIRIYHFNEKEDKCQVDIAVSGQTVTKFTNLYKEEGLVNNETFEGSRLYKLTVEVLYDEKKIVELTSTKRN